MTHTTLQAPAWAAIEKEFRALFDRQWYTNHGPLAKQLEAGLETFFGVRHAVCVVNPAIGLTMALEALELTRPVFVSGKPSALAQQALHWSEPKPANSANPASGNNTGYTAGQPTLTATLPPVPLPTSHQTQPLVVDCTEHSDLDQLQAVRIWLAHPQTQNHPSLQVVLSFAHGQAVQAQGAACILCPCDALAEKLRNIRSSYGMRKAVPVVKTANGRMSEAQAAFGLLALQTLALPPAKRQQP